MEGKKKETEQENGVSLLAKLAEGIFMILLIGIGAFALLFVLMMII